MLTAAIIRARRSFKVQFTRHTIGNKLIIKALEKIVMVIRGKIHLVFKEFCNIFKALKKKQIGRDS